MIEADYKRFCWFKAKQIFFGNHIPHIGNYHFISCKNYYLDLIAHHPFKHDKCNTILINLKKDNDLIFEEIHKKRRNIIRQGLKIGYDIKFQKPSYDSLKKFQLLYNQYTIRKGAPLFSSLSTLSSLLPHMTFVVGKYDDIIAEIMILVHDDQTVRCHKVTRNEGHPRYKDCYHLGSVLQWEVLMHFKRLGYHFFDFGGAITKNPSSPMFGISKYKMSFGGEQVRTYWYEATVTPVGRALLKGKDIFLNCLRKYKGMI
jgi:hypothetical protein